MFTISERKIDQFNPEVLKVKKWSSEWKKKDILTLLADRVLVLNKIINISVKIYVLLGSIISVLFIEMDTNFWNLFLKIFLFWNESIFEIISEMKYLFSCYFSARIKWVTKWMNSGSLTVRHKFQVFRFIPKNSLRG